MIGVGDPYRSLAIAGHSSRQDTTSLKQLAARLGGHYHQGNEKHLPSSILEELTMIEPRLSDQTSLRELALLLTGLSAVVLAAITPALALLGRRRDFAMARRNVRVPGGAG